MRGDEPQESSLSSMRETGEARQLLCVAKESEEVLGYPGVDSFVNGRSHGGVRMRQDVTPEEIGLLARTMTKKYGFLGLPLGVAKAGVFGDSEATLEERRARMARFGRAIGELLRKELFVPAADMGTDLEDTRHMLREAGVRIQKRRLPAVSSGYFTAHSVFAALGEIVHFHPRRKRHRRASAFCAKGRTTAGPWLPSPAWMKAVPCCCRISPPTLGGSWGP
jgi:glutamate dehydrogenase (NAD(P)+)